ncbi:hypothetical protein ACJ72_05154 [Emergomyces africanus]|uniref:WW domain-containing protein n=1 Tax=Emergomyces africanus TaxID=1955775 RepID=A0A1B7NUQ9_9EURO|nr:hypothetical protein ACJ72_05154 [Emergomyces africanus]
MSFAPPSTPPPPRVPDGWKAQFDDRYKQCDPASASATAIAEAERGDVKKRPTSTTSTLQKLGLNNLYNPAWQEGSSGLGIRTGVGDNMIDEDAKLAAKLQTEEDERARDQFQGQQAYEGVSQPQSPQQQQPQETTKRSSGGFLGKLINKASSRSHHSSSSSGFASPYHQQPYQQQYQQQYQRPLSAPYGYGGYPPGAVAGGAGGAFGPQPQYMYGQPPRRRGMGGIGPGGAAVLGLGGGLLGGALLGNAISDHHDYQDGYQDGMEAGDYGGGDFGGGGDLGEGTFEGFRCLIFDS